MALLAQPGAVAKMGGCDILTRYRRGKLDTHLIVGLNDLPGVRELVFSPEGALIGAAVTLAELAASPDFARSWPVLARVMGEIASPAIRSSATVVGNVAQGWSVSDLVPLLQVYNASLELRGPAGSRQLSVSEYARSRGNTALQPGEIITALKLPTPVVNFCVAYERFAFREAFDLPLVAVAIGAIFDGASWSDIRLAAVGGGSMPVRCAPVEEFLACSSGMEAVGADVESAVLLLASWAQPISDFRATAAYRRHVLGVLFKRALSKLAAARRGSEV